MRRRFINAPAISRLSWTSGRPEADMGQKVHPRGFRLGVIESWDSRWYASHDYAKLLHEDLKLRDFIKKRLYHAGSTLVEMERVTKKAKINIDAGRTRIVKS